MSFITEQKTIIATAQVVEALLRMKKLGIHENAIREFKEEGKLNQSEQGILLWLDEKGQEMVEAWQKQSGAIVYHVIKNIGECGPVYSMLYVGKDADTWIRDNEDLEQGYAVACVSDGLFCDVGTIGIKPLWGGIKRTA